ncbi:TIR domain-containing protein [Zobellia nedashkovskayae]|uniref:TIR domain-containing protein n=1 Tax=Zobellia nedashkovskayae TaxID=2779510 RepID=UPI00188B2969|nr:nucleotide-binding protein [Zobellia nedashkovskayae]
MSKLIISNSEFKIDIQERIDIGNELLSRKGNSDEVFKKINSDLSAWNDYNKEYLKQQFDKPNNEYFESYASAGYTMFGDIKSQIPGDFIGTAKALVSDKLDNLIKLRDKSNLLKSSVNNSTNISIKQSFSKTQVFIVHGHDDEAKTKTARFIEKLGFEAIILHEQASSSKTIIEKIEEYSNVGFGIVLYTPCDIGGKNTKEPNLLSRARQNVVFEHGFLIGKIGRSNVCALVKGDLEIPNDISGVVYVQMDSGEAWKYTIAKEMQKIGYEVDMNKI